MGSFTDSTSWKALLSVAIIFGYSLPCLLYSRIYDDEKYKNIAIGGAIMAFLVALAYIFIIWEFIDAGEALAKILETMNVIVWMLAFISWILSLKSASDLLILFKKITICLILLASLCVIVTIWSKMPEGFMFRLYCVVMVLTVGSFICTLILTKIYKKEIAAMTQAEIDQNIPQQPVNTQMPTETPVQNETTNQSTDQNE